MNFIRNKKVIIAVSVTFLILSVLAVFLIIIPNYKYNKAVDMINSGKYAEAVEIFSEIGFYKDSSNRIKEAYYLMAEESEADGNKTQAAINFGKASGYSDASERSFALWDDIADRETVSAGAYHTVAVKTDGTVVATEFSGNYYGGQCDVEGWTDIIAVSAGHGHTAGLKSDGTVVAVGNNDNGQCNTDKWTDIVSISASFGHTVGLKSDGTVIAVGRNEQGQCNVDGQTDTAEISAGYYHSVLLKADGTVSVVGNREQGQGNVDGWTDIVAVSAGEVHTVGLKSDGTVVAVGKNGFGQCKVETWTDIRVQ